MGNLGNLRTEEFAFLLAEGGEVPAAYYQRVGPCPAGHVDRQSGYSPDSTCSLCHGTGTLYVAQTLPTQGETGGKVLILGLDVRKAKNPLDMQAGDLFCTYLEDDYPFAEGDHLVLSSRELTQTQKLKRGSGASDWLRRSHITRIDAIYTAAGAFAGSKAVGGDGHSVVPAGSLAAGTDYTIRYRYRPRYTVMASSALHRVPAGDGSRFPSRVLLRLWDESPIDAAGGGF